MITTHFLSVTKNDFSWLNNLWMARFQLIYVTSWAKNKYRCVQSLNISVDVLAKSCGKCSWIIHQDSSLTFCEPLQKTTCPDWLNNLIMARFLLIGCPTSVKNKLQMCSVRQHLFFCRRRKSECWINLWTFSTHLVTSNHVEWQSSVVCC